MTEAPAALPDSAGWPVSLTVRGRRVVVVGAGRIAARKIETLVALGALVEAVAPAASDEVRAWADAGRITLHLRPFAAADLDGAWLAVAATDDAGVNAAVLEAGEARRVWVNSATGAATCSFTPLSVVRRGEVVVAFGTGGRSPALAAHLRERLSAEIGPEYATLLDVLAEAREELQARGLRAEDADWRAAFSSGIVDLVRRGQVAEAKELLRSCL